jgi:hypothetical protein
VPPETVGGAFVFERTLRRFRESVAAGDYVISIHGQDELEADDLSVFDVERCVLTGRIVERQRDRRTGEWKYVIQGRSTAGTECVVVGKWTRTGKLGVLTAFALDG